MSSAGDFMVKRRGGVNPLRARRNLDNYPAIKTILYSEYYRIFEPNWKPRPQEITDTYIIAAAPYVDIVITERYQAEILRKIRNRVAGLAKLDIATLRDIRMSS